MGIAGGNITDGSVIGSGGSGIQSIVAGMNITVDNTDPKNPIVSSTADDITVVANYSALPIASTVTGQFFWCSSAQGTQWLPGSIGGTYYSAGLYYSNGVSWEYLAVPYQATQSGVDAGVITDQFVTPFTFQNSTQLAGKISLNGSSPATTSSLWMGAFRGLSWENPAGSINNSVTGNSAQGYVQVQGANHVRLYSKNATNEIVRFINMNGWYSNIIQPNNFNTDITMPSSSGTLALLSNIPSVSGFITLTSLSATLPLLYNNTTGVFSIQAASGSQNGYLTSSDWSTFNSKQAALVSGTNIKTVNGITLLGSGDLGIISPTYGGTGVNNGSSTITIGGNVAFTGSFNATIAVPRSTTWTLPNTASETLAGLSTAQTFTEQNTFSNAAGQNIFTLNIRNQLGAGYLQALSSDLTAGVLNVGKGFTNVGIGPGTGVLSVGSTAFSGVFSQLFGSVLYLNQYTGASSGGNMRIGTFSGTSPLTIGTVNGLTTNNGSGTQSTLTILSADNSGVGGIGGITIKTGDHNNASYTTISNIAILTGNIVNAATTAKSGDICFSTGTTGVAGTRGGYVWGNGQTSPNWNGLQNGHYLTNATSAATARATGGSYFYALSDKLQAGSSLYFPFIGTGIGVKTGANGRLFTATLTAGTVTVSNSSVTVNTRPIITLNTGGASGTLGLKYNWVCTSGQIVITSLTATGVTELLDTSTVQVYLIEGL